ncbi:aminotransferase class I/II-fold pyridoxal phosphate-dependent enzyme [Nocardia sp. NRRL WC-3656]|uniref:aminotransferase class I/II-fold pyridoxal phosphate-dependent enzyme n=1 Tax=Nocardia sp. NRRL WC-3656 TaxID=1463824 RepID=UPI0018CC2136|nr:aminotransferase class I/II-fold pyridoxal phosphate-dependent enzyme [Nocardia sp. NRRL WC-3656]
MIGFPGNLDFEFSQLSGLLDIFVNNVGDPNGKEKSAVSAKAMECAVIEFIAGLTNADTKEVYGYVTAGGSEANLFGLDRGCETLPEAAIYCSTAAHYSIAKNARLMRRRLVTVDTDASGRIAPDALEKACRGAAGRGAVVVATIGTTMSGAVDDVDAIATAAAVAGPVYVHADAALGGLIVPFTEIAETWGFARPEVGSIAISMHKGLGMPVPCALAICRSDLVQQQVHGEYIGAADATLGCSRSGLAAILIWYALAAKGLAGLSENALRALATARYASRRLADLGLSPKLQPYSIVVVFDRPAESICRKYHLATEGTTAHLVTVPHVTPAIIDKLCEDIRRSTDNVER